MLREEKRIIREHAEQIKMYDKCRIVDTDLNNQIVSFFNKPYISTLKNAYTGYAKKLTMELITYLYDNYTRIPVTDMAENYERICAP